MWDIYQRETYARLWAFCKLRGLPCTSRIHVRDTTHALRKYTLTILFARARTLRAGLFYYIANIT